MRERFPVGIQLSLHFIVKQGSNYQSWFSLGRARFGAGFKSSKPQKTLDIRYRRNRQEVYVSPTVPQATAPTGRKTRTTVPQATAPTGRKTRTVPQATAPRAPSARLSHGADKPGGAAAYPPPVGEARLLFVWQDDIAKT